MGNVVASYIYPKGKSTFVWLYRSVLVVAVLALVRAHLRWRKALRNMRKIGFPTVQYGKGWLGSTPSLSKNFASIYDFRHSCHEKYGDNFLWQPPIWNPFPQISTRDPAVVKHILCDNFENYVKSPMLASALNTLLGNGIFAINHGKHAIDKGEAWYFQRKTSSKIFTKNQFTGHVHNTLCKNTEKILRNLDRHVATSRDQPLALQTQFFKFTLDTIGNIGFGVDLDTLSQEDVKFANAFDNAQQNIARRIFQPGWNVKYLRYIYASERSIDINMRELDSFCDTIITERLAEAREQIDKRGDILSLFLKADNSLSKGYLRDILMSFFIAGRDTTACTLSFTFMILAENPEIQEKLFQEITSSTKYRTKGGSFIELDELKDMKYLDGVIRECLRLFPPVPIDGKHAVEDDVLPDGTFIPAGTKIAYEVYAMGRDPSVWEKPDHVIPERWFKINPSQFEFPVFQAGPRICLGKDLAMYEAKFATVEILKRFRFDIPEVTAGPKYRPGITMTVKDGCKVLVSNRNP